MINSDPVIKSAHGIYSIMKTGQMLTVASSIWSIYFYTAKPTKKQNFICKWTMHFPILLKELPLTVFTDARKKQGKGTRNKY